MSVKAPSITGCTITPIDQEDCERVVAWLRGEKDSPPAAFATGLAWALAHSDDGVTWGRLDKNAGRWRLGHEAVPEVSPPIRSDALQELRVFGDKGELLIWRSDDGLRGRSLRDPEADRWDETDPLRPSVNESRILRGDRVRSTVAGFTWITDGTGAEQVLPVEINEDELRVQMVRLHVRHYWVQDAGNGTVRVAVTRLVKLTTGERDAG